MMDNEPLQLDDYAEIENASPNFRTRLDERLKIFASDIERGKDNSVDLAIEHGKLFASEGITNEEYKALIGIVSDADYLRSDTQGLFADFVFNESELELFEGYVPWENFGYMLPKGKTMILDDSCFFTDLGAASQGNIYLKGTALSMARIAEGGVQVYNGAAVGEWEREDGSIAEGESELAYQANGGIQVYKPTLEEGHWPPMRIEGNAKLQMVLSGAPDCSLNENGILIIGPNAKSHNRISSYHGGVVINFVGEGEEYNHQGYTVYNLLPDNTLRMQLNKGWRTFEDTGNAAISKMVELRDSVSKIDATSDPKTMLNEIENLKLDSMLYNAQQINTTLGIR